MMLTSAEADIGDARRAAAAYVGRECPHGDADDVVLVVSELVTNAVKHTVGWWRLKVQVHQQRLIVDVEDASGARPVGRSPDPAVPGGRGWRIVRQLAGSVEVLQRSGGKTVRASWLCP